MQQIVGRTAGGRVKSSQGMGSGRPQLGAVRRSQEGQHFEEIPVFYVIKTHNTDRKRSRNELKTTDLR